MTMVLAVAYGHLTVSADKAETAEAFNHDFYATIAAVIPILFLAIAVQGARIQRPSQGRSECLGALQQNGQDRGEF
jgi:hypothetical protein